MEGISDLGGRAAESCAQRRAHLWGTVATDDDSPWASFAIPFIESETVLDDCDHGLWQVTTSVTEYLRSAGEGTLNPLQEQAINDPALGVPANFSQRSQIKLRLQCSDGVAKRQLDMDLNQSVMVVARKLCASWLFPAGTRDVTGLQTQGPAFALGGFVLDSFVGISFTRCEESLGTETAIFTTHLFVAQNTQGVARIPAYARSVTIYQAASIGNASVMWTQHYGNPTVASIEIGALPFIAGARKTQPEEIVPDAQFLRSDIDADPNGRFFTLVWSIRP